MAAGGSIFSSIMGGKAAGETADASKRAGQLNYLMNQQGREDIAPWRDAGAWGIQVLRNKLRPGKKGGGPGKYEESPYYNFLLEQGTRGMERGAAARGKQFSGAENKALMKYGQDLASTDYDQWLNRWYQSLTPYQSLAGLGQQSAGQSAQMGIQTGQLMGQNIIGAGQANAANYLNWGNTGQWAGNQAANYLTQRGGNQGYGGQNYGGTMFNPMTYWPKDDVNSMSWL
jgi:hypothetical protein